MEQVLSKYAEELERQDRSPLTIKNYVSDIELYGRWFTEIYGEAFDPAKTVRREITEYRSFLKTTRNAAPATINRKLASLASFFSFCTGTGIAKQNPTTGIKSIAIIDAGPRALDNTRLRHLLREVHVHGNPKHICILEMLCGTAARVGELVNLTLADCTISERKGAICVRNGKGNTSRQIPMNSDVRKATENWLAVRPKSSSQFLFVGQRGVKMTTNGVWRLVKKYAAFAGIPELRVHDLRHSALTFLARSGQRPGESGVDLVTIAKISGHRSLQTLMRYTAPNQDDLEAALERLSLEG